MPTELNLEEIKVRAMKATPGPWRWGCWRTRFGTSEPAGLPDRHTLECNPAMLQFSAGVRESDEDPNEVLTVEEGINYDDAVFIAHSREDVPTLIAEVERLRKDLAFMGVSYDENGDMVVAMAKYNAAHRCDLHRKENWRTQDLGQCVICMQYRVLNAEKQ